MTKCWLCKTWYEPAKDNNGKDINPTFCEVCLRT